MDIDVLKLFVPPIAWILTTVAVLAWRAARYPSRQEVEAIVRQGLKSAENPYIHDSAAIRRVIERYDRDQDAMRERLDEIVKGLSALTVELRVLAKLSTRLNADIQP